MRTLLQLFFGPVGLCAGTWGNWTRHCRSRRAVVEKTKCDFTKRQGGRLVFYQKTPKITWRFLEPLALRFLKNFFPRIWPFGGIYVATPDDFRTLPVDCTQALLSLCVCVVLLLEPTYKSAAVVCILLLYRNVTCNSHATCNINTTWEKKSSRRVSNGVHRESLHICLYCGLRLILVYPNPQ